MSAGRHSPLPTVKFLHTTAVQFTYGPTLVSRALPSPETWRSACNLHSALETALSWRTNQEVTYDRYRFNRNPERRMWCRGPSRRHLHWTGGTMTPHNAQAHNRPYVIYDWAGNLCFKGAQFDTFEDAWDYLYERYGDLPEDEFNETMGEYYVVQSATRSARYPRPQRVTS